MRKLLLYVLMVVWALSPGLAIFAGPAKSLSSEETGIGHLSLDSCTFDLGTVSGDTIAEGSISFTNTGTAPLQIFTIFSECGCTSSSYPIEPLNPGEKGEIKINFDGKKRAPGPFKKALRIRSNADNPRVVLIVKGTIE